MGASALKLVLMRAEKACVVMPRFGRVLVPVVVRLITG
jgi:hypothetical protein